MYITQGLVDIQVNGFAGIDFNDENITSERLDIALEAMLKCGVTVCLPTIITASVGELFQRFSALDAAVSQSELAQLMIPGYHIEGPFLNPTPGYSGCHPQSDMTSPSSALIIALEKILTKPILIVSYAPEFDFHHQFARDMEALGKCLSVAHSNADYDTIRHAISAGLRLSTHLGNGVPQDLHKLNNTIQAQLSCDELWASFIADGLHIPHFALKSLIRAKQLSRSILVTDAVSAAATTKTGLYKFGNMQVEKVTDGSVRVPGASNLAGSSLSLDQAIRNIVEWEIAPFDLAIPMASTNPLQCLSAALEYHEIRIPNSAVQWNNELEVIGCNIDKKIIRNFT